MIDSQRQSPHANAIQQGAPEPLSSIISAQISALREQLGAFRDRLDRKVTSLCPSHPAGKNDAPQGPSPIPSGWAEEVRDSLHCLELGMGDISALLDRLNSFI